MMVEDACGSVTDADNTFFPPKHSVAAAAAAAIAAAVGKRGADHAAVRRYMPRDHC
jgi:hypothetical protein